MLIPVDPRSVFVLGAEWWAGQAAQEVAHQRCETEAGRYFPDGQMDHPEGFYGRNQAFGSWPVTFVGRAFVEGAKWQEFAATGATMWQSDQRLAEERAIEIFGPAEGTV